MLEPVELKDFFIVFFAGAMVIVAGGLYALMFAWSRIQSKPALMRFAYAAYVVLFVAVLVLGSAAHLHGYWWVLVIAMLLGYLLAPHGIWRLCEGTHGHRHRVDRAIRLTERDLETEMFDTAEREAEK